MSVPVGSYSVTASKYGYTSSTTDVVIVEGATTIQDFTLTYLGAWVDGTAPCFDWTRYDVEYYPATGLIYALGGRSGSDTIGDIYSYNPVTGACADTGANMPVPISNYTVNLVNNGSADVLCTFGGRNARGSTILTCNATTRLTTPLPRLPICPCLDRFPPGAQVVRQQEVIFWRLQRDLVPV
jgi:hypothetical protein